MNKQACMRFSFILLLAGIAMFATTYVNDYGGRMDMYNGTLTPGENSSIYYYQYYLSRVYEYKLITDSASPLQIDASDNDGNILFSGEVRNGQKFYLKPERRGFVDVRVALTEDVETGFNISYTMGDGLDKDVQRDIFLYVAFAAALFVTILIIPNREKGEW